MSETNDQRIYDRCIIRVGQLEEENAKLRELVKECHELLQDLLAGWALQPLTVKVMEQLMRELGIEVDV